MSLIVPSEIKNEINSHSGFINYSSAYGKKNLKGLFLLPENHKYLAKELYQMVCSVPYVKDILSGCGLSLRPQELVKKLKSKRREIEKIVPTWVEEWALPYREDLAVRNPVQELHVVNFEFLRTTSTNIIQNPDMLLGDVFDYDPVTGKQDIMEYGYGASSYSDGTWHPEHLFTESSRNRQNPYWKPLNVSFDSNPVGGSFHPREDHYSLQKRRNNSREKFSPGPLDYDGPDVTETAWDDLNSAQALDSGFTDTPSLMDLLNPQDPKFGRPGPGPGNKYRYNHYGDNGFSKGGQFPAWQYTVSRRHYERDNSEGLGEGGRSDRRTQNTRGYDMSALLAKTSY